MNTENTGTIRVVEAPKPIDQRNRTRIPIEHSNIKVITPAEYERRLAAEGTPLGGVTSKKSPFRTRETPAVKSGLDFKTSLANCDRALIKMGLGSLIKGKQHEDKPLFDCSVPELREAA